MSTILRASGPDFDVDAFVSNCPWEIANVVHRGEPWLPRTKPDGRKHADSGLNVVISEADFHEFPQQLEEAIAFLIENGPETRRLVEFAGVTGVVLDFGITWRDVAAQSDQFPAELVRLAGECGIGLALSHYPVREDNPGVP